MKVTVNARKTFPSFSFNVEYSSSAEITALLGPSGCGKSMFLRTLAGIITPDEGLVMTGDRVLFDSDRKINIKVQERRVGYLFQNYALFPTMNVYKNLTLALKGKTKAEKMKLAGDCADFLGISHLLNRMPEDLSGGEKQRVALARLLVTDPDIILLDEPFSALDTGLRESLAREMKTLLKESGKTVILVTHDVEEAYFMSSHTCLLTNGRILETGDNESLFHHPKTKEGAALLGIKNIAKVNNNFIEEWGFSPRQELTTPFVGVPSTAFQTQGGDYKIPVIISEKAEGLEKTVYVLTVKSSGSRLHVVLPAGAEIGEAVYLNRDSLLPLV